MSELETSIQNRIVQELKSRSKNRDQNFDELDHGVDFLEAEFIDSFALLELLTSVERHFQLQMNFAEIEPAELVTLQGLIHHFSAALRAQATS